MLKDEIVSFTDSFNLVTPGKYVGDYPNGSDNGPMYTSEYFIMLAKRKELSPLDDLLWSAIVDRCMPTPGLLQRAPNKNWQTGPDDMYGVLAAAKALNRPDVAQKILNYGFSNFGCFNTENPGKKTTRSFLWRQPQLLAANLAAAKKVAFYHAPLFALTAIIIATSCYNVETGNGDARRLSWLLIQAVESSSAMCRWAAKIWFKRLYKHYGNDGMRGVAKVYYKDSHPFIKYWVD